MIFCCDAQCAHGERALAPQSQPVSCISLRIHTVALTAFTADFIDITLIFLFELHVSGSQLDQVPKMGHIFVQQ